jgi:hypothetical protein
MKNYLILILILFAFSSCRFTKINDDSKANEIIGKWRMYETVEFQNNDDSVEMKCSTCPQMEFFKNHSGFVKRTDAKLLYFKWGIDNDELTISHTENSEIDKVIDNGTYKLTFAVDKPIKEIALIDTVKNIKYVLSK